MKYYLTLLLLVFILITPGCLEKDSADDITFTQARKTMAGEDLMGRDITDPRVREVMGNIPRHLFMDESLQNVAYNDYPLPIGDGQTISQPYVVAQVEYPGEEHKVQDDQKTQGRYHFYRATPSKNKYY